MQILKMDKDLRLNENNREVVIFCPVGDAEQFKGFVRMMHKLGISMDEKIDFLFVSPPSLNLAPMDKTLSAIYYKENIVKLGTSGAFFAGQVMAHKLGYKTIVVADIDVEMDDPKVLYDCIAISKRDKKIVMPQCRARTTSDDTVSSSVWGFGVFPREKIIERGFCSGFLWKGGEDYDYNLSCAKDKIEYKNGFIYHPRTANVFYTKAEYPKKYYPYLASLMRVFLLRGMYSHYLVWHSYNQFLATLFDDKQLAKVMSRTSDLTELNQDIVNNNTNFRITKVNEQGVTETKMGMLLSMVQSIDNFIMAKPFFSYIYRIEYLGNRGKLILNLLKAIVYTPIELIKGCLNILRWHIWNKNKIVYPIHIEDVSFTEQWMLRYFPKY
jgi:hypothetical protein